MSMHLHARYKAGVIHPDQPLNLPDDTALELVVTAIAAGNGADELRRPSAPKITVQELRDRLARYCVSVGTLSPDFSRDQI